jgi:hypothetical protein
MCVFESAAGEQQNRDDSFGHGSDRTSRGDRSADEQGAAIWAGIQIPVVQPDGWPVYQLQMGLRELERLRRENEAAMALLVGAMPESRDTVADIARNSGVSNREARRRKSVADVCGKVKGALDKLKSGAISNEHVSALAPIADMPGAASLLEDAESKSPEELTRDVEEFRLSSACGEDMAKRQRARRYLRFFAGPEGTIGINGLLPPVEGTALKNRLAAIVDARWRKDHPDRAKVLGGHNDDTYDQRMADALLAMAGVRSQATSTSTNPPGAAPGNDPVAKESGVTSPNSAGQHSQTSGMSTSGSGISPVAATSVAPSTSSQSEPPPNDSAPQHQTTSIPPQITTGGHTPTPGTSISPQDTQRIGNTTPRDRETTDPPHVITGFGSPILDNSSSRSVTGPLTNTDGVDQGPLAAGDGMSSSSGSLATPVGSPVKVTPSTQGDPRERWPSEAVPMKVGLRLVGLGSPPGRLGRNGLAPGFASGSVGSKRIDADPRSDAAHQRDPDPLLGTIVKTSKPAVVIVFDVDRWKARIAGGSPIPITESLFDQARNDLYYCFENSVGEVIKFARSRRDPTPIQKLVLVVRDEKCLYPGCHAPPDACDAHHLNEVVKDQGRTDTDVMGLFCEAHHRHIHLNDLVVKRNPDGSITIIERRTGAVVASIRPRREAA